MRLQVVDFQAWQAQRKAARTAAAEMDLMQTGLMMEAAVVESEDAFKVGAWAGWTSLLWACGPKGGLLSGCSAWRSGWPAAKQQRHRHIHMQPPA